MEYYPQKINFEIKVINKQIITICNDCNANDLAITDIINHASKHLDTYQDVFTVCKFNALLWFCKYCLDPKTDYAYYTFYKMRPRDHYCLKKFKSHTINEVGFFYLILRNS